LEAHGTADGIELTDGTVIKWSTLMPSLAQINEATECNLVVMAVSCSGLNLALSMMPAERAPVAFVVGPADDISGDDLRDGMKRFYSSLISSLSYSEALFAANLGLPHEQRLIRSASAEIFFCRVFRQYLIELADAPNLQSRENSLVAQITRLNSLDVIQSGHLRLQIRSDLADHRAQYDRMRSRYLMLDLFPHNERRFGMTYDLCLPTA